MDAGGVGSGFRKGVSGGLPGWVRRRFSGKKQATLSVFPDSYCHVFVWSPAEEGQNKKNEPGRLIEKRVPLAPLSLLFCGISLPAACSRPAPGTSLGGCAGVDKHLPDMSAEGQINARKMPPIRSIFLYLRYANDTRICTCSRAEASLKTGPYGRRLDDLVGACERYGNPGHRSSHPTGCPGSSDRRSSRTCDRQGNDAHPNQKRLGELVR